MTLSNLSKQLWAVQCKYIKPVCLSFILVWIPETLLPHKTSPIKITVNELSISFTNLFFII